MQYNDQDFVDILLAALKFLAACVMICYSMTGNVTREITKM